jgi:hypothetical protein
MIDSGSAKLSESQKDRSSEICKRRKRSAAASLLTTGIAAAFFLMIWIHGDFADTKSHAQIGQPLPLLTVENQGNAVDLKTIGAGMRCVIVFYSPSCRICREVLPGFRPFPNSLRLIFVNESTDRDDFEHAGFPNAVHVRDKWRVLPRAFAIVALPTILFVDENGILREGMIGLHDPSKVRQKLQEFVSHSYEHLIEKP